jgi:hypothetical protein
MQDIMTPENSANVGAAGAMSQPLAKTIGNSFTFKFGAEMCKSIVLLAVFFWGFLVSHLVMLFRSEVTMTKDKMG